MTRLRRCLLVACAVQPVFVALAGGSVVVDQVRRSFSVHELRVRRGDVVRFTNSDEFLHHIYVDSPSFSVNSGEQEPGREVDIKFTTAGRFDVLCEIHPRMRLAVTVD